MRIDWTSLAPVGVDGKRELKWLLAGLTVAAVYSVYEFCAHYFGALDALYYHGAATRMGLIPGAVMADFSGLMVGCDGLFSLVCLVMPFLAVYHYMYHYQGAKAIYLMRRLPDGMELHRRCLTIPVAGLTAALALLGLLGIIFYLVYIHCTPAQCLPV